ERPIRLVGTDMSDRAIGRHLCDAFHRVPRGSDPAFADTVLQICRDEHAEVVLPQSSFDLLGLAEAKDRFRDEGVAVAVCSPEAVRRSNDKAACYRMLHDIGVPAPEFRRVRGATETAEAAEALGYPDRDVCFKPVFSSGSRGFRVLSASADRQRELLENRPGMAAAMQLGELT